MIENKDYKIHYKNFDRLKMKGVYLIRNLDNKTLKIGITDNLPRRYKEIIKTFNFCGSAPKLQIECYIEYIHNEELEKFLHKELQEFNYQNEWFSIDNIDIVLQKLSLFEYEKVIIKDNKYKPKVRKIHKKVYKRYTYYKFKGDKDIFIRYKGNAYDAVDYLNSIYYEITSDSRYHVDEYYGEIVNPEICSRIDFDPLKTFDKFNKDVIVKINDKNYVPFELYIFNEYKNTLKDKLNQTKNLILEMFNDEFIEPNNNIQDLSLYIENVENLCIDIQKELNNCIRNKNIQNYKELLYKEMLRIF